MYAAGQSGYDWSLNLSGWPTLFVRGWSAGQFGRVHMRAVGDEWGPGPKAGSVRGFENTSAFFSGAFRRASENHKTSKHRLSARSVLSGRPHARRMLDCAAGANLIWLTICRVESVANTTR